MEECMRDSMRKLAIWDTRTFKPIMTHDELEPIMATMGFLALTPTSANGGWKDYVYSAASAVAEHAPAQPPPTPGLPYPRIDGLHVYTYRAFIDAVNFYLEMCDISDLFHIRGMPLHRINDRSRKWRRMGEDDSVFVFREGTVDQVTYDFYHFNKPSSNGDSIVIRDRGINTPISFLVLMKDIIPMEDIIVCSSSC